MSIGPISPLLPLPVNKIPERREEWPIFDVENAARTDDEYDSSGGGSAGKGADDDDQAEFDQHLATAEQDAASQTALSDEIEGEPPGTVSFFA